MVLFGQKTNLVGDDVLGVPQERQNKLCNPVVWATIGRPFIKGRAMHAPTNIIKKIFNILKQKSIDKVHF